MALSVPRRPPGARHGGDERLQARGCDAVISVNDGTFAQVHLTWAQHLSQNRGLSFRVSVPDPGVRLPSEPCGHGLKQVKGQCADQVRRDYRVALRERIGSPGLVVFASPQARALGLSQGDVRADFREIEP